jgi:hypothetical protein
MGPLFSAGLVVTAAIIVAIVLFVVIRAFFPTREAIHLVAVLLASGAVGAVVALLVLAPFFTGETLTTTAAAIGYLGTIGATAILFAAAGAAGYRKWKRQSNRAVETDARKSGARGSL